MSCLTSRLTRNAFLALPTAVVVAGLAGCSLGDALGGGASSPTPSPSATSMLTSSPIIRAGVCIDPTGSTVPMFSKAQRKYLEAVIRGWAPAADKASPAAQPGSPGLALAYRVIGEDSFSSQAKQVNVSIPAVPALAAMPNVQASNMSVQRTQRIKDARVYQKQAAVAHHDAGRYASKIDGVRLWGKTSSIWGCVSALASQTPRPDRVILMSDLADTDTKPVIRGHFRGMTVLIVQATHRSAARTATLRKQWTGTLKKKGARVQVLRPEDVTPQVLTGFLRTGKAK